MTSSSGRSLSDLLDAKGLRRWWLAGQMDIARQTFSSWEHGHERMPERRIAQLAQLIGEDVETVRQALPGTTEGVVVA